MKGVGGGGGGGVTTGQPALLKISINCIQADLVSFALLLLPGPSLHHPLYASLYQTNTNYMKYSTKLCNPAT